MGIPHLYLWTWARIVLWCPSREYWIHFCKLVYGMRIILRYEITAGDLAKAHQALLDFCREFKVLYCQRLPE